MCSGGVDAVERLSHSRHLCFVNIDSEVCLGLCGYGHTSEQGGQEAYGDPREKRATVQNEWVVEYYVCVNERMSKTASGHEATALAYLYIEGQRSPMMPAPPVIHPRMPKASLSALGQA